MNQQVCGVLGRQLRGAVLQQPWEADSVGVEAFVPSAVSAHGTAVGLKRGETRTREPWGVPARRNVSHPLAQPERSAHGLCSVSFSNLFLFEFILLRHRVIFIIKDLEH